MHGRVRSGILTTALASSGRQVLQGRMSNRSKRPMSGPRPFGPVSMFSRAGMLVQMMYPSPRF